MSSRDDDVKPPEEPSEPPHRDSRPPTVAYSRQAADALLTGRVRVVRRLPTHGGGVVSIAVLPKEPPREPPGPLVPPNSVGEAGAWPEHPGPVVERAEVLLARLPRIMAPGPVAAMLHDSYIDLQQPLAEFLSKLANLMPVASNYATPAGHDYAIEQHQGWHQSITLIHISIGDIITNIKRQLAELVPAERPTLPQIPVATPPHTDE